MRLACGPQTMQHKLADGMSSIMLRLIDHDCLVQYLEMSVSASHAQVRVDATLLM